MGPIGWSYEQGGVLGDGLRSPTGVVWDGLDSAAAHGLVWDGVGGEAREAFGRLSVAVGPLRETAASP